MIIRRIDENKYSVDGQEIGNIYDLQDCMNSRSSQHIGFRQVMFMVSHRSVAKHILEKIPGLEYHDEYYGLDTRYPTEVVQIKPYYPIVSASDAHIHMRYYRTATNRPEHIDYLLNNGKVGESIQDLLDALAKLKIYLSEGQVRFIIAHGLNEEQSSKYPNLRFTSEKIQYDVDRRSAESRVDSPYSDKTATIKRLDDTTYQYNGVIMDSWSVRKALQEDGFIINKNVLSMIFGQGKIPKSVAEKYPNLNYEDLR